MARPATASRRDVVLHLLREAGPSGVTPYQFGKAGIACAMVHMESLRFEGHVIDCQTEREGGGYVRRCYLRFDAWADEPAEALAGAEPPAEAA